MEPSRGIAAAFRGIRYRGRGDLSALIAPPYDVISEEMQARLYARDPHNFVRIELPRNAPRESRYQAAAATLAGWREEGVLGTEDAASVYLLEQEFEAGGETRRRRAALCLVRLPEEGERYVLSHEGTLAAAKADRLELMRACQAMTSPVMLIHEDEDSELLHWLHGVRDTPEAEAVEHDGVRDRLWAVSDETEIRRLIGTIGVGPLAIADGHHRFETAMAYRREMRERHPTAPGEAEFNYALVLITSARDPALAILPTHRLIAGLGGNGIAAMKEKMREVFDLTERALTEDGMGWAAWNGGGAAGRPTFGVYYGGDSYSLLSLREEGAANASSAVARLDVSIIHRLLIDPVIAGCSASNCEIEYMTSAQEAVERVRAGDAEAAILLRRTRIQDVLAVAKAGERMPGKSTYFYPKAPAGLVLSSATAAPIR